MIDLHTHILPGIDDGSKSVEMSLELLRREKEQGVDTVVLTPHYYRQREHLSDFLKRRSHACRVLLEAMSQTEETWPRLYLGAEVAWSSDMLEWEEISQLCIGGSEYMLLEMPFSRWNGHTVRLLYNLMSKRGVTPVIAHLERFLDQPADYIQEILSMGVPVQLSAEPMLHVWKRRPLMKMLRSGEAQFLASDCHNTETRLPNLGDAMRVVERKLGQETAVLMDEQARQILHQAQPLCR